ncbi:hypothetical protein ABZ490_01210 [Streptomyces sp. NPDC005811]|uniref:hypothetical protein n=1 Tax=Streptomyces sp. NPDC005811 TaxID=3154565 RepID=UPI0033D8984F
MGNLFKRATVFTSAGAAGLVVLTACGGGGVGGSDDAGQGGRGDVASITTPAAGGGAASASADPDAGRPQIRLDSTNEEVNRLYDAWLACLKEHGAAEKYKRKPNDPSVLACKGKEPLDPPELDPARNPDFSDDTRAMVKCMNEHGIKSVVADGLWALEDGNSLNAPHYDDIELDCQVKAYGDR